MPDQYANIDQATHKTKCSCLMDSLNYISRIFNVSECTLKNTGKRKPLRLFLSIDSGVYESIKTFILANIKQNRQAKSHSEDLAKFFVYVWFNVLSGNSRLKDNELVYDGVSLKSVNRLKSELKSINILNWIVSTDKVLLNNNFTYYKVNPCMYSVLINPDSLSYSSKYVKLVYNNTTINTIIPIPNILVSQTHDNSLALNPLQENKKIDRKWSMEQFLALYQKFEYVSPYNNLLDIQFTNELQKKPAELKGCGRIYHYFHSLPKERRVNVRLNGSPIVEAFDVHNCQWVMLYCLLDDSIPYKEKELYYSKVISGRFYEDVMSYVNGCRCANWSREDSKLFCNTYINLGAKRIQRASKSTRTRYAAELCVDQYFNEFFPHIREFILNRETIACELFGIETEIMVSNVCKTLYEKYGVDAVTLHDAVFISKMDLDRLIKDNVCMFNVFRECVDNFKLI